METQFHSFEKQAVFLSGGGGGDDVFDDPQRWIVENTFEPDNWVCNELYAIDGATRADGLNALNDDNLFFIYRGHGDYEEISLPFFLDNLDLNTATNTIYPMTFSIACLTNCFGYFINSGQSPCIGESWIRSEQGGVSFLGASTITYRTVNNRIHEKLFDDAYSDTDQLVPMINLGMKNFYQTFWSFFNTKTVKRHMMSYNYLGDPSFIRGGIGCIDNIIFNNVEIFHDGDSIIYQASNTIETNNTFDIQTGSSVTLVAGESIVLKPGFHAGEGSNFHAYIAPCEEKEVKNVEQDVNLSVNNLNLADTIQSQIVEKEASVFPNPFTNYILLNYYQQTTGEVIISIFDIKGNKVYEEKVAVNKGIIYHNVNTSNFQTGTYIYNINTESILYKGTIIKIN